MGSVTRGYSMQNRAHAQIYVNSGSTAQGSIGATEVLLTAFNTAAGANGPSSGMTANKAANKITVLTAGDHIVSAQMSFSGSASARFNFHIYVNGAHVPQIHCSRVLGSGGDVGSCSMVGLATIGANQDVEIYVDANTDPANKSLTVTSAQLVVEAM